VSAALGVGVIGTGWMARAHVHALRVVASIDPATRPVRLVIVASSRDHKARSAAAAWGAAEATDDWRRVVAHDDVDVVINAGSDDLHAAPSLAALEAGRAVLCEKPLATEVVDAQRMATAATASSASLAVCGFNYRFVPAVRLLHELITEGRLGELHHLRAAFLQDWAVDPDVPHSWRFTRASGSSGPIGDYAHILDLAHHLGARPVSVNADAVTIVARRPAPDGSGDLPVEVPDIYAASCRLAGGGLATFEASRVARGRKGHQLLEVYGSEGAAWWDLEDPNRLHVTTGADSDPRLGGFRDVLVTEREHPFGRRWWGAGHVLGWDHALANQWLTFLDALDTGDPGPLATFADGARVVRTTTAIARAAATGTRVELTDDEEAIP
jgi:predicted dehydrogenase